MQESGIDMVHSRLEDQAWKHKVHDSRLKTGNQMSCA